MPHPNTQRAHVDKITELRLKKMPAVEQNGLRILKNFAVFFDTHRDQPHVGSFYEDIHRGQCRPVMVDYLIEDDSLVNGETGEILMRNDKHLFVTPEFYSSMLVTYMMDHNGQDPRDGSGCMPSSHFRDARAKVYELKSFREMVRLREMNPPKTT